MKWNQTALVLACPVDIKIGMGRLKTTFNFQRITAFVFTFTTGIKLTLLSLREALKRSETLSGYFCYNIPQLHSRKSNSFIRHKVFMDIGYILLQKSKSIGACNFSIFAELADSRKCFQMDWKSFFGKTQ